MKPTETSYEDEMQRGGQALRVGNLSKACAIFQGIIERAGGGEPAEVHEQLGIVWRLIADQNGNDEETYKLADAAFAAAKKRATSDLRLAQIYRNWSMVALNQGDFVKALGLLTLSCSLLRPVGPFRLSPLGRLTHRALSPFSAASRGYLVEDQQVGSRPDEAIHVEFFVTQGFIARLYSRRGGFKNKREARRIFRQADRALRGYNPYELDNLIWLFKIEWPWRRLTQAPRLVALAKSSGNPKRQVQAALLIISPYIAAYVERKHNERKVAANR